MKVCFICRTYPPVVGGMEDYASSLVKHLRRKQPDTGVIVNTKGKKNIPFFFMRALFRLFSCSPDVYHLGDGVTALMAPLIRILKRKPVVTTIHGLDITYNSFLYQKLVVPCIRKSDRIIAVSAYTRKACMSKGIPKERITIVHNALDREKHRKPRRMRKDRSMMISVGRQIRRKGIAEFIKGKLNSLMKDNPSLGYYIIGDGPESARIKKAISRSEYRDRIFQLGRLSDRKVQEYYQKAAYFAMPNMRVKGDVEGFGIVILEAIHYSLVILANPIEGIKDALNYTRNWIDLNRKSIILRNHPYRREKTSIGWEDRIKEYIRVYKSMAEDRGGK